jgi:hypothetical protein
MVANSLDLAGALGLLKLDDIVNGTTLSIGGDSGQRLCLYADQVGVVDLTTAGILSRLRVRAWAGGTLQATVFENLATTAGAFAADLVNVRVQRTDVRNVLTGYGLKCLSVNGPLTSNILVDRAHMIRVTGGDAQVDVTVISDDVTLDGRSAFGSISVTGGDLVDSTFTLEPGTRMEAINVRARGGVGGNVRGALGVTGSLGAATVARDVVTTGWDIGEALGRLSVKGTVRAAAGTAAIRTGGGMAGAIVGAIQSVDLLAGIDPAAGRTPTAAADFLAPVAIGMLKVTGVRAGPGPKPRFMIDCNLAAASIGTATLMNCAFAGSAVHVLDQGGAEIERITHRDTVDRSRSWVYPPRPNQVGGPPAGFINQV